MPFTLRLLPELGIVRLDHEGAVTADEILTADAAALASPLYRKNEGRLMHVLAPGADLSAIDFDVLEKSLAPAVHARRAERGYCRVAWVMPDDWNRPIGEVWKHMGAWEGYLDFALFSNEDDALEWLGRPAPSRL